MCILPRLCVCAHVCQPPLPQASSPQKPLSQGPHLLLFPLLVPEGAVALRHLGLSKRLHHAGRKGCNDSTSGSCGEFLQRLPSSKRLLFTESSGCCGFPTFTWGKGQTCKKYLPRMRPLVNQHALQQQPAWAGNGRERVRKKHRACLSRPGTM